MGQLLQNSSKVQIKVRDDSSTLTLIDCGFDSAGIYEVQAVNALGSDKCRASLTVNKMTEDEKVEYEKLKSAGIADLVADEEEKVIEKKKIKEERKEKVPKKDVKKVEEKKTYDWKKNVKKVEKKEEVKVTPQENIVLKKPKQIEKAKEQPKQDRPQLKPAPPKSRTEEDVEKES